MWVNMLGWIGELQKAKAYITPQFVQPIFELFLAWISHLDPNSSLSNNAVFPHSSRIRPEKNQLVFQCFPIYNSPKN